MDGAFLVSEEQAVLDLPAQELLSGQRVVLLGRLAGMSKREAQQLIRRHGGCVVEPTDTGPTLVVVSESDAAAQGSAADLLGPAGREAFAFAAAEIIGEAQLWQRLGLVDRQQHVHSLYTPAMLAGLIGVEVSAVRRWLRRGWIKPFREIRRLPYFDFQEVATARRLKELLSAGATMAAIDRALAMLVRQMPGVARPLAELSVTVEGRHLLLRQGDGLVEPGGQLRFDFGALTNRGSADARSSTALESEILAFHPPSGPSTPAEMIQAAEQMEDEGHPEAAVEMYRAAMVAGGPSAEVCFLLAELLYQSHDLSAARERYYMAIELDEDYVEARANLGCVLAELGEDDLAISAFEGALAYHDDYADVHYHLGRILDQVGRGDEAVDHWETFLRLAPTSPWADEARQRLGR